MTRNEIIEQLTPIVQDVFNDNTLVLTEDLSPKNVPTWTSLSFMRLLDEIGKHFGFKFKIMEILYLQDMGAIIDSINQHLH